ncbi:MAG TPA: YbhB/YbcL family Raf kinase inhibitor-like protein [Candidatus Sulfotelmatobacter sp.]|nr:YbhB/YbcL family Raf kinase inhibitor-like protein [Candidatus Sulfotelmatobacter sp.]
MILVSAGLYYYYTSSPYSKGTKRTFFGKEESMTITSTSFTSGSEIPKKYTCDDADVNPPLTFHAIPPEAKSLALIVEDKDSTPKDFTHWTIFNLNTFINGLDENTVPDQSVEGVNSFGNIGYEGPCPPGTTHHYVFKLFALDQPLNLERGVKKEDIISKIQGHILDEAELIGTYKRE